MKNLSIIALLLLASASELLAGSATWNANPVSGDWNTDANWIPATVPNGSADVATFDTSNQAAISLSAGVEVNGITFNSGANAFQIAVGPALGLTLSGTGITNDSANTQNFVASVDGAGNSAVITFSNNATAGSSTSFSNSGSAVGAYGGGEVFTDNAAAGSAEFDNMAGTADGGLGGYVDFYGGTASSAHILNHGAGIAGAGAGLTDFFDSSSAGNSSIENNPGIVDGALGAGTFFSGTSTAGTASFQNFGASVSGAGAGSTNFFDNASADHGVFTNSTGDAGGGATYFSGSSTAGEAAIVNEGQSVSGGVGGFTRFFDTANAGSATITNDGPTGGDGSGSSGNTIFFGSSSAANATITNNGSAVPGFGGITQFYENTTAADGTFINNGYPAANGSPALIFFWGNSTAANGNFTLNGGTVADALGGGISFLENSTAANGNFTLNGGTVADAFGGGISFQENSTAGNATLTANAGSDGGYGGDITFGADSTGGTSRIKVFGNGTLSVGNTPPVLTIGSLEGNGYVFLFSSNLTVGSNNISTIFAGLLQDDGAAGSLSKIGSGTLSLTNANAYGGGTQISGGTLEAKHDGALGSGDVTMLVAGTVLTLQDGATNDYIADTATLNIVSSATVNLNFSGTDVIGTLIIDGVAQPPALHGTSVANRARRTHSKLQPSGFVGTGQILAELPVAVSRKVHGSTPFDVYLPLTGSPGIECRDDGTNTHQIVVSFLNNATFDHAEVDGGAMLDGTSGNGTQIITIDLSNVPNQQVINVTLAGLNDGLGLRDLVIPMGFLIGDTNASGVVNASDISQTKSQSGQSISVANFREDVTVNNMISASDISAVKAHSGTGLPGALAPKPVQQVGRLDRRPALR